VVVSACHLPLDFGSKNPSPFVGRRFVRDVAVSALLTTHNARYIIIIIIIIIISCRRIPPRPTRPSPPSNNMSWGHIFCGFFPIFSSRFFVCRPEQSTAMGHNGGIPICKRRGRSHEFSVPTYTPQSSDSRRLSTASAGLQEPCRRRAYLNYSVLKKWMKPKSL